MGYPSQMASGNRVILTWYFAVSNTQNNDSASCKTKLFSRDNEAQIL
jgi:hypothetical protein